jgi:hypothetical protein
MTLLYLKIYRLSLRCRRRRNDNGITWPEVLPKRLLALKDRTLLYMINMCIDSHHLTEVNLESLKLSII